MQQSTMVTVVFTDIVGSTQLLSSLGESAFDDLRRQHFAELRVVIAQYGGTEVKNLGDGLMVVFSSVSSGVGAAVAMTHAARRVVAQGIPVDIRAGVAVGDAVPDDGDWFGTPVVEAARLCSAAGSGEVWATAVVRTLASGAATFHPLGTRTLKGFDRPVEVVLAVSPNAIRTTYYAAVHEQTPEMAQRMTSSLDYWEQLEGIQQVRQEMRRRLAVGSGDVVVDVGCGTGTELADIASAAAPTGRAIGIDPSALLLDAARRRLNGLSGVELLERSGFDTGLADGACDAFRMERVVQHTGRLDELLNEAHRIVRPGGRVVVADTDWGSLMIHPGDHGFVRRFKAAWENGPMAEPWAGRMLHGGLLDAGFVDVSSTGFYVSTDVGLLAATKGLVERSIDAGLAQRDEYAAFAATLREAFERGDGVWSFVMFVAWGRRP